MTRPPRHPARLAPAEWERHDATWLAWPHNEEDWPGKFGAIEWVLAEVVRCVSGAAPGASARGGERVEVLCNDAAAVERARDVLTRAHAMHERVRLHVCPTDRSWLRDSAPTFVRAQGGSLELVHWRFNAWAKYDDWERDAHVPEFVERITGLTRARPTRPDDNEHVVMEGGAIDFSGEGTVLVTEECLLDQRTQARNPGLSREGYERVFDQWLGAHRTVWLAAGCAGDDTHGHIDDVARFVPPTGSTTGGAHAETVLLAYEEDPADVNHASSVENERRLCDAGLHVVTVPYPAPVVFEGRRLPASYANFYACNACVLVPTFNDPNDRVALNTIADLFPDRPVVGVHSLDLVWGLGTIHCLTQQQPAAR